MTSRDPKGVPTGGRFAPQSHAEADIELVDLNQMVDLNESAGLAVSTQFPATAKERSGGAVPDPDWYPGKVLDDSDGRPDLNAVLDEYDQWQARAGGIDGMEAVPEFAEQSRRIHGSITDLLAARLRAARNIDHDDPDWEPGQILGRHPDADGPSIDELVDERDRWRMRQGTIWGNAAQSLIASRRMDDVLNQRMSYLVHSLAHRAKLSM